MQCTCTFGQFFQKVVNLLYSVKIHTGGMDLAPGFGESDFGLG